MHILWPAARTGCELPWGCLTYEALGPVWGIWCAEAAARMCHSIPLATVS